MCDRGKTEILPGGESSAVQGMPQGLPGSRHHMTPEKNLGITLENPTCPGTNYRSGATQVPLDCSATSPAFISSAQHLSIELAVWVLVSSALGLQDSVGGPIQKTKQSSGLPPEDETLSYIPSSLSIRDAVIQFPFLLSTKVPSFTPTLHSAVKDIFFLFSSRSLWF